VPIEPNVDPVAAVVDATAELADELANAERTRVPIDPISERFAAFDVEDAYRVQTINLRRRLDTGAARVGHKVGLTNRRMQEQLGVDEPDFGFLLDDMQVPDGHAIPLGAFIQPRIEPEICFLLDRDVVGPGISRSDVMDATSALAPALEVIDSRIADWKIKLVDTVADNASSARVVVGTWTPLDRGTFDVIAAEGWIERDGEVVATGHGSDVFGDPAHAVAWLANKLAEFGGGIRAGEIVIPGALTASLPLGSGKRFTAAIDGLGSVSVGVLA
jgi:2-keto-4-pentenoate hydratase